MINKYDIIGLGACGVDLRATVPNLCRIDGKNKIMANNFKITAGGVTANNLIQASKLGQQFWIIADKVGKFNMVGIAGASQKISVNDINIWN